VLYLLDKFEEATWLSFSGSTNVTRRI